MVNFFTSCLTRKISFVWINLFKSMQIYALMWHIWSLLPIHHRNLNRDLKLRPPKLSENSDQQQPRPASCGGGCGCWSPYTGNLVEVAVENCGCGWKLLSCMGPFRDPRCKFRLPVFVSPKCVKYTPFLGLSRFGMGSLVRPSSLANSLISVRTSPSMILFSVSWGKERIFLVDMETCNRYVQTSTICVSELFSIRKRKFKKSRYRLALWTTNVTLCYWILVIFRNNNLICSAASCILECKFYAFVKICDFINERYGNPK